MSDNTVLRIGVLSATTLTGVAIVLAIVAVIYGSVLWVVTWAWNTLALQFGWPHLTLLQAFAASLLLAIVSSIVAPSRGEAK